MSSANLNLHTYGRWTFGGDDGIAAGILGDKHPIRVFSSWISDMGNAQNTCKLIRLATELFRAIPYVQTSERCMQGLETAGKTFEKLRDLPAITYFFDRLSHLFFPDPNGKDDPENSLDRAKYWLGRVKDVSDCAAMGILTKNIIQPIFSSSENKLMDYLDPISLGGDIAEFTKHTVEWYQVGSKRSLGSLFNMRGAGMFISTSAATVKQINVTFKRELAPEWALKLASAVGTSLKLYASYSAYSRDDGIKMKVS